MNAPIDIVISIIKRHLNELEESKGILKEDYYKGQKNAYEGLIEEFEGFKKLFN